jgi:intein/homing endonuclease
MASFPHLIDLGVMGSCHHGKSGLCLKAGIKCYQNGLTKNNPNMKLEDYKRIIDEIKDKTFQCLEENELILRKNPITQTIMAVPIKDIVEGDWVYNGQDKFVRVSETRKRTVSSLVEIYLPHGKTIKTTEEHKFPIGGKVKKVSELRQGDILTAANFQCIASNCQYIDLIKEMVVNDRCMNFFVSGPAIDKIYDDYKLNIYRPTGIKSLRLEKIKDIILNYNYYDCVLYSQNSPKLPCLLPVTKELAYLLGNYIGNGSKRTYVISNSQTKMINNIKSALNAVFPNFYYSTKECKNTTIIELSSRLPHIMVFDKILMCRTPENEKQIPNVVWSMSEELKKWFLRGYFCDGNFRVNKRDGLYGAIILNTSSQKLAKDLCLLLATMGVKYCLRTVEGGMVPFSKSEPRLINRRTRHRIQISNFKELIKLKEIVSDHKNADIFF